jgi:hypothetical protein
VQPVVQAAWDLAVGGDMKYEGAVNSDGPAAGGFVQQMMGGYMEALFELATCDERVSAQVLLAMGLVSSLITAPYIHVPDLAA